MPTPSTAPHVTVVGSYNRDLMMHVPSLPIGGETILGSEYVERDGGKGSNQAIAAARLEASTRFVGHVGADRFGDAAIDRWDTEGIEPLVTQTPETHTGVAMIAVDEAGENAIMVAPGANATVDPATVEAAGTAITETDILVTQLEIGVEAVERALTLADAHDVPTLLNPAPAQELPETIFEAVDILVPNRMEARQLTGRAPDATVADEVLAAELRARGAAAVIITQGSDGALVVTDTVTRQIPPIDVEIVDTTGAGDAFCGAVAAYAGAGQSLVTAAVAGTVAGGLSCQTAGVVPGLPTRAELQAHWPAAGPRPEPGD